MKNLNAIVWLYRGETEKYEKLLDDYGTAIRNAVAIDPSAPDTIPSTKGVL